MMKVSVVCLLFASLLVVVLPRGNEGHKEKKNADEDEYALQLFDEYDKDNNGYISLYELRMFVSEYNSQTTAEYLMNLYDTNNDNQLNFEVNNLLEADNIGKIFRSMITVQLIYGSSNI